MRLDLNFNDSLIPTEDGLGYRVTANITVNDFRDPYTFEIHRVISWKTLANTNNNMLPSEIIKFEKVSAMRALIGEILNKVLA